ncbi:hypothetical protein PENTCL1PPCAC_11013, partial [Pristionchus entomophagus]
PSLLLSLPSLSSVALGRMPPLLLYQLIMLLVPLGLLQALCGGAKKKRKSNAGTARSNVSIKSAATRGSKSGDELLRTAMDSTGRGGLQLGDDTQAGTTTENKSGRISLHGAVHNTDTGAASMEQADGDHTLPSVEEGGEIKMEKAAPGKVSLSSKDSRNRKKKVKSMKSIKEKEPKTPKEVTASNKEPKETKEAKEAKDAKSNPASAKHTVQTQNSYAETQKTQHSSC